MQDPTFDEFQAALSIPSAPMRPRWLLRTVLVSIFFVSIMIDWLLFKISDWAGVDEVMVVSEDGSPHGPKTFVLWNPPLTMPPKPPGAAHGDDAEPPTGPNLRHMSRTEARVSGKLLRRWALSALCRPMIHPICPIDGAAVGQ